MLKRVLQFTFFLFFCIQSFAQMDTEHWFAPFADRTGGQGAEQYLYLSTDQVVSFNVKIYNNNTLFQTVSISKGNPQIVLFPRNFLITSTQNQILVKNSMGLHLVGDKKFFANVRFAVNNHAEIITSKGKAGLGTLFYAAMAPITAPKQHVNSTIGITATEDNTSVTLSDYNPGVRFSDGTQSPTKSIILNRGESYIVDVISTATPENTDGLIGAKISASKPVSVTNGNFNAIYTQNNSSNNDVLMDQSVPVERLGKEFAIIKGNGDTESGMETPLVVATENNTEVYINNNATPIGILQEGEYLLVPSSNYINQANDVYNMRIQTSKNAYVYQLLGGTSSDTGNPFASGGMNFIPALSCFLPNKIEELALISEIGQSFYNAKLNIISQKGASVSVNGNLINGTYGPYPIAGNNQWETFSVPNVSGNVTVTSTKAVTAGIAAGNGAVGYGGYFAGFNSVPVISKGGNCDSNNIILEVDNSYDSYQWFWNGNPISGATQYFIYPTLPGYYTVEISKNNCGTVVTPIFKFVACPKKISTTYTIGKCNTLKIIPQFSTSAQNIKTSSVNILTAPQNGNASVNASTGEITYIPTSATATSDVFTYYFEGNSDFPDSEIITVNVSIVHLSVQNANLNSCLTNGLGTYNLGSANLSSNLNLTYEYFEDAALSQIIPSATVSAFVSVPKTVYVKIKDTYGCSAVANIVLQEVASPNLNVNNFNTTICDDNVDGTIPVNFSQITPQIVNNTTNFTTRYYLNQNDALAGNNNVLPNNWQYSGNTTVYVRVENNLCPSVFGQLNFAVGNKVSLFTNSTSKNVCDENLDGNITLDLQTFTNNFSSDTGLIITFYNTFSDAQQKLNSISNNQTITGNKTFYIRFEKTGACPNIAEIEFIFKSSKKSLVLTDKTICAGATTTLDAGSGFDAYLWNTGATTPSIENVGVGDYYVDVSFNGCVYRQHVKVLAAEQPVINAININGNNAEIVVSGGNAPYQYSLDGIIYQNSPIFSNLTRGKHKVYVISSESCAPVEKEFLILNLINVITPNDDGYNDVLDYSDLGIKSEVRIEIYDRYGTLVHKNEGRNFVWDGKSNGRILPTATYWYIIQWKEPDNGNIITYTGWILLKNRNKKE